MTLPGSEHAARWLTILADAAEWRLLGLLFECPREGWAAEAEALAKEISDPRLLDAAQAASEGTEGLYHTLFGPGGPVPPREVSYRETLQPGQTVAEISAFYDAFAYNPVAAEPPDHVAVEAGFIAWLRLKEAYAVARGDATQASIAAEAADRFLEDHLSLLAEPIARTLEGCEIAYLQGASEALLARVGPKCTQERATASPLHDVEDFGCSFDCGGEAGIAE